MATKANPGIYDCYDKLEEDEPYFLFRSTDKSAPDLVRAWAITRMISIKRGEKPKEDMAQVDEAFACATAMEAWFQEKVKALQGDAKQPG